MASNNKVEFGLKNVHYALFDATAGKYGTPKPWRGAVSLSTEPQGDTSKFFADDVAYYVTDTNSGESGTLEVALATDDVKIDLLGYEPPAASAASTAARSTTAPSSVPPRSTTRRARPPRSAPTRSTST